MAVTQLHPIFVAELTGIDLSKPIDDATNERWRTLQYHLRRAVIECRAASIPFAIVLVPGDFQTETALADEARAPCCQQDE